MFKQPYLHDRVTVVSAPSMALGPSDGQLRDGVDGIYVADRRILSRLVVTADGCEPVAVRAAPFGAERCRFVGVVRELGDPGADPTVTLERTRTVLSNGAVEQLELRSAAHEVVTTLLELEIACDDAEMAAVKSGDATVPLPPVAVGDGLHWTTRAQGAVRVRCTPPPDHARGGVLGWQVEVAPGGRFAVTVDVDVTATTEPVVAESDASVRPDDFSVRCGDHRLPALVDRSLADLAGLVLADPQAPADAFLAAGAPWFLTLFGRDSIWAARMMLPLGTDLAAGTLRTLARRQATETDTDTAQQPGKIMHEIRPSDTKHGVAGGHALMRLPALYYGTIDATPLWISLLHDAWRQGMPADEVQALLPNLDRAMEWLLRHSLGDHGFVAYHDASGRGLANQGWKDSGDSVQFRDGIIADAPIALCEVQGYAYAAARHAATLADAYSRPGADGWRAWADELRDRFRSAYWLEDGTGRYPAIALDGHGKPVDTVTSNIAHLLGTGILDAAEEGSVVDRLSRSDLDSGFGLRTLSRDSRGFNPLGYHTGSVWTHDTAIAIGGLAAAGTPAADRVAASLIEGLLAAAPAFEWRMPELFGGHARAELPAAVPYPAACRPQAWSATASVTILAGLLGLQVDVPRATVRLRPLRPSPCGAMTVSGLRYRDASFTVHLDEHGDPTVTGLPRDVRVVVE